MTLGLRRAWAWIAWSLGLLAGLPLLGLLVMLAFTNTEAGRDWIVRTVADASSGQVLLTGFSGRVPDEMSLGRLELRDGTGAWLSIEGLALDWSPLRLLAGEAEIARLEAAHITMERLPPPSPEEKPSEGGFSLPMPVSLKSLRVGRLDLGEAVIGKPASLTIDGKGHLASLTQGEVEILVKRLDGEGTYILQGHYQDASLQAHLTVAEPAQGLLGSFAGIEELDALSLDASAEGPLSALQARLNLTFGPLRGKAQGRVDVVGQRIDGLALSVTAPAMQPRPDLAWQAIALDAQAGGPFNAPSAQGKLRIDKLSAAAASASLVSVDLQGDMGQVKLSGAIEQLKIPGPKPGLLETSPIKLQAGLRLDVVERPLEFSLQHPLIAIKGKASLGSEVKGAMALSLPDLQPFAALVGQDLRGKAGLDLRLEQTGGANALEADGIVAVTGGQAPWPKLLGDKAKLGLAVTLNGPDIALSRLALEGKAVSLSANGALAAGQAGFQWTLSLNDLAALSEAGSGRLAAQGWIKGPLDKLAVNAELSGELATKELPRGPIKAQIALEGLPKSPVGHVTAQGVLGGSPLDLSLNAQAPADGSVLLNLERADWKSAHGEGKFNLPKGAQWPLGKMDFRMERLAELRPLLGQPVQGNLSVSVEAVQRNGQPQALLKLEARDAGLAGTATIGQTRLDLTVVDLAKHPVFDGRLGLEEIEAGTVKGGSTLDLAGPLEALGLRLSADVQTSAGDTRLMTEAKLDAPAQRLVLAALEAGWKGETLRLLEPARLDFAKGLAVDHLKLGFGEAVLEVAGQASPRLDLDASLGNVSARLAKLVDPKLDAVGTLRAEAHLTGNPAHPSGLIELEAWGVQMRSGPGRGLPPAKLTAHARLDGASAQINTRLDAGHELNLNLGGEAPLLPAGRFDLHAQGGMDLKLLDPLLAADGRRVRGRLALDASLAGTLAEPLIDGTARLSQGEVLDFSTGAQLSDLEALLEAHGGTVRLTRLTAKAGPGKITASGEVDLAKEGLPVELTLATHNARPLASDRLTVNLDSNLSLRGQLQGSLVAAGSVHILEAEIRIPERLPTSIAVLKVRRPGEAPPPPASANGQVLALDLTIDAPRQIYVRGRGLDAELGGKIRVRGRSAKPQPDGVFALRRGQFSLAGQTLTFSKGEVGFDGGSLTDPSLNFLAKTTSGTVTANLAVTGTANKPKIGLSSIPELPQDEVLSQLLFGRTASSLSPLELAQIASALASLSGVTSGFGDPLESVRKGLGLDRLSVGASLEAGRYVAPGVYVGAKQGITGGNSQATVQIDITRGLKLEGSAGIGGASAGSTNTTGTNSVGVIYQYEY